MSGPSEAMAYADQSWSKCVGADGRTRGMISDFVDLNKSFSFGDSHSAEFDRSIQKVDGFYRSLLNALRIPQNE
jgi:hypothetical protein